jgi:hypothetical protein
MIGYHYPTTSHLSQQIELNDYNCNEEIEEDQQQQQQYYCDDENESVIPPLSAVAIEILHRSYTVAADVSSHLWTWYMQRSTKSTTTIKYSLNEEDYTAAYNLIKSNDNNKY